MKWNGGEFWWSGLTPQWIIVIIHLLFALCRLHCVVVLFRLVGCIGWEKATDTIRYKENKSKQRQGDTGGYMKIQKAIVFFVSISSKGEVLPLGTPLCGRDDYGGERKAYCLFSFQDWLRGMAPCEPPFFMCVLCLRGNPCNPLLWLWTWLCVLGVVWDVSHETLCPHVGVWHFSQVCNHEVESLWCVQCGALWMMVGQCGSLWVFISHWWVWSPWPSCWGKLNALSEHNGQHRELLYI